MISTISCFFTYFSECATGEHLPEYYQRIREMAPGNPKLRVLYAIWAFLECICFGGLIYGWGSLVYVLKDEGLYSDLCPPDLNSTITSTPVVTYDITGNETNSVGPSIDVDTSTIR